MKKLIIPIISFIMITSGAFAGRTNVEKSEEEKYVYVSAGKLKRKLHAYCHKHVYFEDKFVKLVSLEEEDEDYPVFKNAHRVELEKFKKAYIASENKELEEVLEVIDEAEEGDKLRIFGKVYPLAGWTSPTTHSTHADEYFEIHYAEKIIDTDEGKEKTIED